MSKANPFLLGRSDDFYQIGRIISYLMHETSVNSKLIFIGDMINYDQFYLY